MVSKYPSETAQTTNLTNYTSSRARRTPFCHSNDLNCSPNIVWVIKSRRMRWAWHVARVEEVRVLYREFVGKFEGKRPLVRPRRRWDDNIKMDVQEL
jgi:hypothetical protein